MNGKFMRLLSDTFVFAIGNVFSKVILFFLMPLYTTTLTTEQYGVADLLNNSIELFLPVATLCISDAVYRFVIDEDSDKQQIFNIGLNVLLISFAIVSVIILVGNIFIKYEYTCFFLALYMANATRSLFANFARGMGHIKKFVISGIINTLSLLGFNMLFLLALKLETSGYLLAIILSNVMAAVYLFFSVHIGQYCNIKRTSKEMQKEMLIFSLPNVPNMVSWWFNNVFSRYIVSAVCGIGIAGMFSAACKLPSMINLLATIFQQAWQFSASKESKSQDSKQFFTMVFEFYSAFIVLAGSAVIFFTPLISRIVLRGDFYEAWHYVPLLLVSAVLGCYSIYFGTFYLAVKKNLMSMVSTVIGAVVNVVGCFVLIPKIGVYGAVYSNIVSYFIIVIVRMFNTKQYSQIDVKYFYLFFSIFLLTVQAIIRSFVEKNVILFQIIIFLSILVLNVFYNQKYISSFFCLKFRDRES
ncbi:lipopolysaccharide biosynthesis protein [Desulfitobacterium metallireducens]|uniref:Polysaccharide biosynthesis protein n=1 Tax=Desulfitobacterium metallireducens DSM 15288 TaxID=871968 RepID=W0EEQ4_9FIRM|nr:oligosaccharide flippase family protein [Desulfitobacterium metallireducens]AHF07664.1 polysaccharide biosynthesis protein [Desulfitobacterium metallireducens DSM 15288]